MENTKHTPGPWVIDKDSHHINIRPEGQGYLLATIATFWAETEENTHEANARLIAAAPDLLAALEQANEMLKYIGGCQDTVDKASKAISKAKGE